MISINNHILFYFYFFSHTLLNKGVIKYKRKEGRKEERKEGGNDGEEGREIWNA